MTQAQRNRLIVIGGPTASGKTSLAIKLAQHFNTEILSADSRQCYKELSIGVAKPSKEELGLVKHHFIDSHSIHEEVTAGVFMRYGLSVIEKIFEQNDTAICVGGTGLYLKALCEGLDNIPPVDKEIKIAIEQEFEEKGLTWLQEELKSCDETFYKQVDTANHMRLLRALIFFKSHQKSILTFTGAKKEKRNFDIEYYAIDIPRQELYNRANLRVDMMLEEGLLEEVTSLVEQQHIKALKTVGYKEIFAYLNGEMSLQYATEKVKQHTRNYAKRQVTWFKNQGDYNMLSPEKIALAIQST